MKYGGNVAANVVRRRGFDRIVKSAMADELTASRAELAHLRSEVEQLRVERQKLEDQQATIVELIGTKSVDRLLHDLRGIMNERALLRRLLREEAE